MFNERRTVLHVDDDLQITRAVTAKLKPRNIDVISLHDPMQVLPMLVGRDIRVVLLDIDMPGINGLDLLRKIKAHDGGIQVIMLTGLVSMSSVLDSMRGGAEACIFKPITDFQPLFEALNAAFTKHDRWWACLEELHDRRRTEEDVVLPSVR
jgi:DNA-binding NtrC family response regulator